MTTHELDDLINHKDLIEEYESTKAYIQNSPSTHELSIALNSGIGTDEGYVRFDSQAKEVDALLTYLNSKKEL